jgi:hypothetical protein
MLASVEMDEKVWIQDRLEDTGGPVILINNAWARRCARSA